MLWTENEATVQENNNNNKNLHLPLKKEGGKQIVLKDNSKKYPIPLEIGHHPVVVTEVKSLPSPQRWCEA